MQLPLPPQISPVISLPDTNAAFLAVLRYLQLLTTTLLQQFITSFATWTPGTVANGGWVSATVSVNNANPGAPAIVGFTTAIPTGMWLTAFVSAANTVTVTLFNLTGSPQTIGAGILQVTVLPQT